MYKQKNIYIYIRKKPLVTKTSGSLLYHTNDSTKRVL